jgi:TolB protein
LLAFTFGDDAGEQIYLVSARGGHPRQLTHELGGSVESGLTFSHGERRLRYFSELDALSGHALWTMNADGTGLRRLTREASDDTAPAWSPDGRRVAFSRSGSITVIDSNGSGEHPITRGQTDTNPVWSPDGKRIAFQRAINHQRSDVLVVVNADGSGLHVLRNTELYGRPSWSPDGRAIVYAEGGTTIMSIAPNGTHKHALIHTDGTSPSCVWFTGLAFSPDGTHIAAASNYCGQNPGGLWLVRADGSDLTRLTAVGAAQPSWSADGSAIVFSGPCPPAQSSQICTVDANGSHLRALTTGTFDSLDPNWSPQ